MAFHGTRHTNLFTPLFTFRVFEKENHWWGSALDVFSFITLLAIALRTVIRLCCERIRIVEQFCVNEAKVLPVRVGLMQQLEKEAKKGGAKKENILTLASAVVFFWLAISVSKLFTTIPSVFWALSPVSSFTASFLTLYFIQKIRLQAGINRLFRFQSA